MDTQCERCNDTGFCEAMSERFRMFPDWRTEDGTPMIQCPACVRAGRL